MNHNFAHDIIKQAALHPDATAIVFPGGGVTYAQLSETVLRYASALRSHGVVRSSRLLIHCSSSRPEALLVELAAALLGTSWAILSKTVPIRAIRASHLVHIEGPVTDLPGMPTIRIASDFLNPVLGQPLPSVLEFEGYTGPEDVLSISATSGSTGTPKLVPYTVTRLVNHWQDSLPEAVRVGATLFPVTSARALSILVRLLKRGRAVAMVNSWDEALRLNVDELIASPAQIDQLLQGQPVREQVIPSVHSWGGFVPPPAIRNWLKYAGKVTLGYGSSEGGGNGSIELTSVPDAFQPFYRMADNVEFEIVDEDDRPVPAGTVGVFRLRSPFTVSGYIDNPVASAEVFRNGWFYPGDLAVEGPGHAVMMMMGRLKDQLNFGGVKVNAADIDLAVAQVPGVQSAVAFDFEEPGGTLYPAVLLVLESGFSPEPTAQAARHRCRTILRQASERLRVFVVPSMLLSETGKPLRRVARELAAGLKAY